MRDRPRFGTGLLAGLAGGVLVGTVDGLRAAALVRVDAPAALRTALLCAALDGLAGAAAGAAIELLLRVRAWGRSAAPPWWARALGWLVAGAGAAAAAAGTVAATSVRNNRFLAAGLAALAAAGTAIGGALLAPVVARLCAGRRPATTPLAPPTPAALLLVPGVAALLGGVVFLALFRTRAPLRGSALFQREIAAAAFAALLPWAMHRAASVRAAVSWRTAGALAAVLFGAPAAAGLALRWQSDLRFAPWVDIVVGAAILAAGAALTLGARCVPRAPGRRAALAGAGLVAAVLVVVGAGASEAARKAASARSGLAAPLLGAVRAALDRDHDGYPRLLGGGDCDDSDPDVHPGALDWPGDGIDQDCDGHDASASAIRSPPLPPVPDSVPRDLNILFVTIDTLRADHVGCYGYDRPTSPVLDGLAAEGTVFLHGWAHAPSTRYSMPAIATGRWPSAIDWDESIWWPGIGRSMRTIGEALHDLGYFTGALYSYSYFNRADRRGFERGIDDYQDRRTALHVNLGGPQESRGSSSREMADDSIAFIDAHRNRKFFLWVHFYDPHLTYERHPEVPSFGERPVDLYDGEVRFTDLHVGRIFGHLRRLGLWDRTAVFVTGDHGEGFGEHGIGEPHGFDLYAPQTKVPFIVRVPGLPPRRSAVPVGHVDIAPTMVNLARGPHEPGFLGRSMLDILAGGARPDAAPVFQEVSSERGKKRALVDATHHVVWNWVPDNTTECYELLADPREAHDVWGRASADPACVPLRDRLREIVAALSLPPGLSEKLAAGLIPAGAAAPPPQHQSDALLGDAVRVLGWDGSTEVAPGDELFLTYHFESLRRLPSGWRLFFHLEGPAGFRNLDHVPVEGAFPLERWRPGQRILDRHRFRFDPSAPRGVYTLYLGAWRGTERLPVSPAGASDGRGRLRLLAVTVR